MNKGYKKYLRGQKSWGKDGSPLLISSTSHVWSEYQHVPLLQPVTRDTLALLFERSRVSCLYLYVDPTMHHVVGGAAQFLRSINCKEWEEWRVTRLTFYLEQAHSRVTALLLQQGRSSLELLETPGQSPDSA